MLLGALGLQTGGYVWINRSRRDRGCSVSTMLLPLLAFIFGTLLITVSAMAFMPRRASAIEQRLEELTVGGGSAPSESTPVPGPHRAFSGSVKAGRRELGQLRLRTLQAGYRPRRGADDLLRHPCPLRADGSSASCPPRSSCGRTWCGPRRPRFRLPAPGYGSGPQGQGRAHRIRLALADMLDLLVVGVGRAGLDQAVPASARSWRSRRTVRRLRLISLGLRVGKARSGCCAIGQNRTGVEDLSSLVTMRSRPTSSAPAWRSRCACSEMAPHETAS